MALPLPNLPVRALAALVLVGAGAGCSNAPGGAQGATCLTVQDCAEGLVCVPKSTRTGPRICSSNTAIVQTEIDAGVDATAADGAMMQADAAPADVAAPIDTAAADVVTPADTGSPADAPASS